MDDDDSLSWVGVILFILVMIVLAIGLWFTLDALNSPEWQPPSTTITSTPHHP